MPSIENMESPEDDYNIDARLDKMEKMLDGVLNLVEENAKWRKIYKMKYTTQLSQSELAAYAKISVRTLKRILLKVTKKVRSLWLQKRH